MAANNGTYHNFKLSTRMLPGDRIFSLLPQKQKAE